MRCNARPNRLAVLIVNERSGEDVTELLGDWGTLDNLLEAAGIDVVLHLHALSAAVLVDESEPLPHALEKHHVLAELAEGLTAQADALATGLIVHHFHIRKHIGCILTHCELVGHIPKLLRRCANRLDESELLHIARRKGSVEVIDKCYNRFSHFLSRFVHNIRKK